MKKLLLLLLLTTSLFYSCGPKVYLDTNSQSIVENHQTIAILPPKVAIAPQKKVDAAALLAQQKNESVTFQSETYAWLLKRKTQNRIAIDIQDINKTNALLEKAGYNHDTQSYTPEELASVLGVDAVLVSKYSLSKPMSQGGAIALAVLTGLYGSTNSAVVNLFLHDKTSSKMFWSYKHQANGGILSSPSNLVDALMRNASKKMPYQVTVH